jgi:cyclomaltodextrin glucanotransferase
MSLTAVMKPSFRIAIVVAFFAAAAACAGSDPAETGGTSTGSATGVGAGATGPGGMGGVGGDVGGQGGEGGVGGTTDLCATTMRFSPSFSVQNPRIAGEWHDFDLATASPLEATANGFEAVVELPPGLHAYKLVYDVNGNTEWHFDDAETRRKYVDGVENSGVLVPDCNLPGLEAVQTNVTRPAPGQGAVTAVLDFVDAFDASGPDPEGYSAELVHDFATSAVDASAISVAADGTASIDIGGLDDGKYSLMVVARTQSGRVGEPKRVVFWVEAEAFDWRDAIVYMVMTDRFANGSASNDPDVTAGADPRGDWQGGDLQGVTQAILDGKLDDLGIRAIWLTPFNENPEGAYLAADGQTLVTGYHGYWPTRARTVDPRLGGEQTLQAMVEAAHAHGIRILMDFVINHVHEDHEYMAQHPDWFRTGCVCGTANCDWTGHALDCMFREYMPDIDHTVPDANQQFVDDAVWWLDRFDLDGLRVDAVKHVEEIATRNLSAAVRDEFEAGGTTYFLMGETAMGWSDCADPCNDDNYGTIAKYVGPHGLDGQFDFVLYHGVSYRTFAYGEKGMLHADYWLQHGLSKWPEGAIMTPYIGSHDTSRFVTMADYRGQDAGHPQYIAGNQWSNTAEAPSDSEPYRRMRIGMSWVLMLPGAPLLYYGDEYGQWGGADPNNRMMWKGDAGLTADEQQTLDHVRLLGQARRDLRALRRGNYLSLGASEDTLVFARDTGSEVAIVALTRNASGDSMNIDVSGLGLSGATLSDAMGGPNVSVGGSGNVTLSIPGSGTLILHP